jgi:hypothetical protein
VDRSNNITNVGSGEINISGIVGNGNYQAPPVTAREEPADETDAYYSNHVKIKVIQRLDDDWLGVADHVGIKPHERKTVPPGQGPRFVWEWLAQRGQLRRLRAALLDNDRADLVQELDRDHPAED